MRKLLLLLVVVAVALGVAIPAFAQDRPSIPELLTDDTGGADGGSRFTTLLAAVEAAGLGDALSGDGPFTILAPTNDAFDAELAYLGLTADDLLANTDLLTSILTYHVIPGEYFFRNLVSDPALDSLQGEPVQFNLDGGILTANGVTVGDVDNVASNGVVHTLEDGVLLPAEFAATVAAGQAHIRLAHFSSDAGAVDIYINGELSELQGVEFTTVSDWMSVPAGDYEVAVAPAGTTIDDAVIGPATLTFSAGSYTTVAAIGSAEAGTLAPAVISETVGGLDGDTARVTVFHGIEGGPVVNVTANGDVIVDSLAFPGSQNGNDGVYTLEVPAGTYDLAVTLQDGTVLLDAAGTELTGATDYLIAAIGTVNEPQLSVTTTDDAGAGAVLGANASMMMSMMSAATETAPAPVAEPTPEVTPGS